MPPRLHAALFLCLLTIGCFAEAVTAQGSDADTIGVTALRQADPTLTGFGINLLQPEAPVATNTFEVNPATVGMSPGVFTYINSSGGVANSATFPNNAGSESWHANIVASNLYTIAPGVSSVDNYDANYYLNQVVGNGQLPSTINPALHNGRIVNQSFVLTGTTPSEDKAYIQLYDSYASQHNVLFVSGAGNSVSPPQAPSTAYNGICVNAYSMTPPTLGPTSDGRSKPDLTAPGTETSYSTADVSGAAALLLQAANRGDGGTGTATAAGDIRTMKALLLNGATKPDGWTHTAAQPLDPQYGAGMVNVYQSWQELKAGNQVASVSAPSGQLEAPVNMRLSSGWDLGSLSGGGTTNHYFFTSPDTSAASDTFTATLAWNVSQWDFYNNAVMNNLDLALYDTTGTPSLVSISDSMVDNVQQLYVNGLAPGHTYDLRVYESAAHVHGGAEAYGLAFSTGGTAQVVPEPASIVLLAAGAAVAGMLWRRRANSKGQSFLRSA